MVDVFIPQDPEEASFRTHPFECLCLSCSQRKNGLASKHAFLGDIDHMHTATVPDHGPGLLIDGHHVEFLGDWNDD